LSEANQGSIELLTGFDGSEKWEVEMTVDSKGRRERGKYEERLRRGKQRKNDRQS